MDSSNNHDRIAKKLQDVGAMLEMQAAKLHGDGNDGGALSDDYRDLNQSYRNLKRRVDAGKDSLDEIDRSVDQLEEDVTAWMADVETTPPSSPAT